MDPIDILDKVNSFYSNAFSQLLTITLAILGFGGVILPIILQIIQSRSFRIEQKSLEAQITNQISETMNELKDAMEKQIQAEKELLNEKLKEEIQAMTTKINEELSVAKAGTFFLQGTSGIDQKLYSQAACDYSYAAEMFFSGKDDANGLRALEMLIETCMPKLDNSSFEEVFDLDESINKLIKTLKSKNENGRFTDSINSIVAGRKNAQKKVKKSPVTTT